MVMTGARHRQGTRDVQRHSRREVERRPIGQGEVGAEGRVHGGGQRSGLDFDVHADVRAFRNGERTRPRLDDGAGAGHRAGDLVLTEGGIGERGVKGRLGREHERPVTDVQVTINRQRGRFKRHS